MPARDASAELALRKLRPQRHRLLHGYPMTPLLRASVRGEAEGPPIEVDPTRDLIVGVLPHTQCTPKVEGCGFCTFPHDAYHKRQLLQVVHGVSEELSAGAMKGRAVTALYLGGATANLTPPAQLRDLLAILGSEFDLRGAEVTLEGVPALFLAWWGGPLEVLRDGPGAHKRVSMGVQTFALDWLARMGRDGFGDRYTVEKVVGRAHGYGMTTSGDFLLGLPGRALADELEDLAIADAIGLDQICVYPLVLSAGSKVPWARDPAMLAGLPSVSAGLERWLTVRRALLDRGFVQSTLTNFERGSPAFRYEVASFSPDRTDALGFGPLSITTLVDRGRRHAKKTLQGRTANPNHDPGRLWFHYDEADLSLLLVTRMLATTRLDRARYRAFLGADLLEHHGPVVDAVVGDGLATLDADALSLTPEGTWFADAVAGTFAAARADEVRAAGAGIHTTDLAIGRVLTLSMG